VAEDKHSKKHPASDQKKRQLKKKGTVAKSQDVPMAAGLLAAFAILVAMDGYFMRHFKNLMTHCFQQVEEIGKDRFDLVPLLLFAMKEIALLSLPVLAAVLVIGVVANVGQSGFILTGEQLKPNLKKINPMTKLKQWFSIKSLQELGKSLAKILIAGFIGYLVWKSAITTIVEIPLLDDTMQQEAEQLLGIGGKIIASLFWKIIILYVVVATIDYMFQKKNFLTEHKMTDKEVRDEYKNQEGDPYMKAKRRQMAQQIAMNQSAEHVDQSDVVVINPTELAIALKYDPELSPVPYVISKSEVRGADDIREAARKNGVPVVRNKPLARALYEMCEIGDIVPEDLYKPVAEVLAYVFALKDQTSAPEADVTAQEAQAPVAAQAHARHAAATSSATSPFGEPVVQVHDLTSIQVPVALPQPGQSQTAAGWTPSPAAASQPAGPMQWAPSPSWSDSGGWIASPEHAAPQPGVPWADQLPSQQ
jgi:flagellar biosynthesis protein FlhB